MRFYVRRNGETVGPVDESVVNGWIEQGMLDGEVLPEGTSRWMRIQQGGLVWSDTGHQVNRASGGGCSTVAIVCIAGVVLLGGCGLIVANPITALAIVFVGVPFVVLVLWVTGVLLAGQKQA